MRNDGAGRRAGDTPLVPALARHPPRRRSPTRVQRAADLTTDRSRAGCDGPTGADGAWLMYDRLVSGSHGCPARLRRARRGLHAGTMRHASSDGDVTCVGAVSGSSRPLSTAPLAERRTPLAVALRRYARRGAIVGRQATIIGAHPPLGVQALTACTVLEFDVDVFVACVATEISISRALNVELALRFEDVFATIGDSAFGSVRQRLIRHLLALANDPDSTPTYRVIDHPAAAGRHDRLIERGRRSRARPIAGRRADLDRRRRHPAAERRSTGLVPQLLAGRVALLRRGSRGYLSRSPIGERRLRGREARDRHAERRAGHVVEPDPLDLGDRLRVAAVLAADPDLEARAASRGPCRPRSSSARRSRRRASGTG